MRIIYHNILLVALTLLAAINIFVTVWFAVNGRACTDDSELHHTFVGDDFPEIWPLPPTPNVALVVEDPVRYSIGGLDAREEWAASTPKGFGYIRLGPEHRAFAVSMYHQLHCLRLIRSGLAGDHSDATMVHFGHCLNYLRQLILCNADLTLEPYDVLDRDFAVKQDNSVHVCQDWHQAYDAMSSNWDDWQRVRHEAAFTNMTSGGYA